MPGLTDLLAHDMAKPPRRTDVLSMEANIKSRSVALQYFEGV